MARGLAAISGVTVNAQSGVQRTKCRLSENVTRTPPAAHHFAITLHSFVCRSCERAGTSFDMFSRLCKSAQVGPLSPYLSKIGERARGPDSAQGTVAQGGPILCRVRSQCAGKTASLAQGRVTVNIEINEGSDTKVNGIEVTLAEAVQWMHRQTGKAA